MSTGYRVSITKMLKPVFINFAQSDRDVFAS